MRAIGWASALMLVTEDSVFLVPALYLAARRRWWPAARSPLALIALPSLASRLTSANETDWGPGLHSNATVTVGMAFATIDAARRIRSRRRRSVQTIARAARVLVGVSLLVDRDDVPELKPDLVDTTGHRVYPEYIAIGGRVNDMSAVTQRLDAWRELQAAQGPHPTCEVVNSYGVAKPDDPFLYDVVILRTPVGSSPR